MRNPFITRTLSLLCLLFLLACGKQEQQPIKFTSLEDLNGCKVSVLSGTTHDQFLSTHYPSWDLLRLDQAADLLVPLLSKQAHASLLDGLLARQCMSTYPELAVLQDSIYVESIAFGVDGETLQRQLSGFLKRLEASGQLKALITKWEEDDGTATTELAMEDLKGRNVLRVGIVSIVPYSFIRNGQYCGMDLDLLMLFCASQNMRIEISEYIFSGLLASLITHKEDVICGGIAVTEERAKQIRFSDVYYYADALILTRAEYLEGHSSGASIERRSFATRFYDSFYNNLVKEDRYKLIVQGLWNTLYISVFAVILGTLLAAVVCYLSMSRRRSLQVIAKVYVEVFSGVPEVVLLMIMFYVIFASSSLSALMVAAITFALNFAANVSDMFRTAIESVDKGQKEAGIALGFSRFQTFIYIILPQAIERAFPLYKGGVVAIVKMTSIVGYIAVHDITKAGDIIRSRTFDAFFPLIFVAVLYYLLARSLTQLLTLVEKKYAAHH